MVGPAPAVACRPHAERQADADHQHAGKEHKLQRRGQELRDVQRHRAVGVERNAEITPQKVGHEMSVLNHDRVVEMQCPREGWPLVSSVAFGPSAIRAGSPGITPRDAEDQHGKRRRARSGRCRAVAKADEGQQTWPRIPECHRRAPKGPGGTGMDSVVGHFHQAETEAHAVEPERVGGICKWQAHSTRSLAAKTELPVVAVDRPARSPSGAHSALNRLPRRASGVGALRPASRYSSTIASLRYSGDCQVAGGR